MMQLTIHINEEMYLANNWFLLFNGQKIKLNEKVTTIPFPDLGELEFLLLNDLKKKTIEYLFMWIASILIAPINILLMNTSADWYNKIILSSMSCKLKCNFQNNANIFIDIKCRNYNNYTSNTYKVEVLSTDSDLKVISLHENYDNNTLKWEINKYLSKTFSIGFWSFLMISIICYFSEYYYKNYLIIAFAIMFIAIFILVTSYTAHKSKKIKLVLETAKKYQRKLL